MQVAARVQLFACFLIAFGVKLALLGYAASPVPFADEWDGEAAYVLKPFLEGQLHIWDLFRPHNEHLMPLTRLLALASFRIAGYWDVVFQMIVNAAIHAFAIVFIGYFLSKPVTKHLQPIVWLLCVIVASIPYGWENLLLGFNTHFYLLILFSFVAFAGLTWAKAWSPPWFIGTAFAIAACFNMASGALTLAVAAVVALLQCVRGERRGAGELFGIAAHVVLTAAMLFVMPHLSGNEFQAHSVGDFMGATATLLSWPTRPPFGLVTYAPVLILFFTLFRSRAALADGRWSIIAGSGWVAAQVCAIAIGRANGFLLSSRYFDALQIGMMINLASVFVLLSMRVSQQSLIRRDGLAFAGWGIFLCVALALSAVSLGKQIDARRQSAMTEAVNLRAYLATGNVSHLAHKSVEEIGYPVPERLRAWLDDPTIRQILPPTLKSEEPTGLVEDAKNALLFALPPWLMASGLLAFLLPFAIERWAPKPQPRLAESRD